MLTEGLRWIQALKIDSHRAEMTLFEAGRAYAAADDRLEVTIDDLRSVAPLALRQRQTNMAADYYAIQVMNNILGGGGFSSRAMDSIRNEQGLAYSVYSYFAADQSHGIDISSVSQANSFAYFFIERDFSLP